jgi:hypothetical protein
MLKEMLCKTVGPSGEYFAERLSTLRFPLAGQ